MSQLNQDSAERIFISVEKIRSIGDWARTYTWNLYFKENKYITVPDVFQTWFPATECDFTLASIDSQDFTGGIMPFSIPKASAQYQLNITLLDEYRLVMSRWLRLWMNSIINIKRGCVLPIKNACCICNILYSDSEAKNIKLGQYYVYPNFSFQMQLNSNSDIVTNQVEFNIAGIETDFFLNN